MKKLLLLLWMGTVAAAAAAQSAGRGLWCPPGAVWKYASQSTLVPPTISTYDLRYTGDSTLNGQSCQKLSSLGSIQLTKADADRVWQYKLGQFYKVHDFSAQPGDSWPYAFSYGMCTETTTITVDSVGQRQLGGQLRRWFVAHYTVGGQTVRWGRIYEGIGPVEGFMHLFPQATRVGTCSMPPELSTMLGLRCFSTAAQPGLVSVANGCQALPTAAHKARSGAADFAVYPTAGPGQLTVKVPAAYTRAELRVFSPGGQLVRRQYLATTETTLHLQQLPRGLYLISVQQASQPALSRRIVLQ